MTSKDAQDLLRAARRNARRQAAQAAQAPRIIVEPGIPQGSRSLADKIIEDIAWLTEAR